MGSPAGISSSTDAAASISASRSSSIRRWRSSAGRSTRRRSTTTSASRTASSCAGTTSSRSPSSRSRRTSARSSRSRSRSPRPTPRRSASPSPGSWASPTRCSTSRRTGCGSAAGCPTRATACRPTPRSSSGSPVRLPELAGVMSRRFAALVLAVVAATGLLASPAGTTEVRAAAPDLSIVTDARYDVQPEAHRVRVTLDMVMKNRLTDTSTRRYYFDHALLVRAARARRRRSSPGLGPADAQGEGHEVERDVHDPPLDFGARLYSGKRATYRLVFDIVDTGGAADRQVRVGDSLVSFPVWAFASESTPGSTVRVVFPAGYQVEVASGDIPAPTTAADGTVVLETGGLKTPLTFFAYLVADRSGATTDRTVQATVGGTPVALTVSAWSDDAAWGERVGDLAGTSPAGPRRTDRARLAAGRRAGHPRERRSVQRRLRRAVRPRDGPDRRRLRRERRGRPPRGRPRLVRRLAAGRPMGDRGLRLVLRAARRARPGGHDRARRRRRHHRRPSSRPRASRSTPGAPSAASRGRPRTTRTRRRSRSPGRSASASATTDCRRSGPTRRRGPGHTSRRPAAARSPRPSTDRPTGAACSTCSTSTRPTSLDDLWRTWVARPEDLALLDARGAARARYAAVVASAGDWQLPRPVRDAMRAWRFDDAEPAPDRGRDAPRPADGHRDARPRRPG